MGFDRGYNYPDMKSKAIHRTRRKSKAQKRRAPKSHYLKKESKYEKFLSECSNADFDKEMERGESLLRRVFPTPTS